MKRRRQFQLNKGVRVVKNEHLKMKVSLESAILININRYGALRESRFSEGKYIIMSVLRELASNRALAFWLKIVIGIVYSKKLLALARVFNHIDSPLSFDYVQKSCLWSRKCNVYTFIMFHQKTWNGFNVKRFWCIDNSICTGKMLFLLFFFVWFVCI